MFKRYNISLNRLNDDKKTNTYGYKMVELCKYNDLFILNGRLGIRNMNSNFTCKDKSSIDYFVATAYIFDYIHSFDIKDFNSLFSDSHCSLSLHLNIKHLSQEHVHIGEKSEVGNKHAIRLWVDEKGHNFCKNLNLEMVQEVLLQTTYLINHKQAVTDTDINGVISKIEELFLKASKSMFGIRKQTNYKIKKNNNKSWFDNNCKMARNSYHMIRRLYNRNETLENKNLLKTVSKEYKNVIKQSISRFKTEKINKLKNLKNAKPKEFWKIINSVDKKENNSNVPLEDLYKYFEEINAQQNDDEIQENNESSTQEFIMLNEEINQAITANEIFSAIKSLKNNKSSGLDNILYEHI